MCCTSWVYVSKCPAYLWTTSMRRRCNFALAKTAEVQKTLMYEELHILSTFYNQKFYSELLSRLSLLSRFCANSKYFHSMAGFSDFNNYTHCLIHIRHQHKQVGVPPLAVWHFLKVFGYEARENFIFHILLIIIWWNNSLIASHNLLIN